MKRLCLCLCLVATALYAACAGAPAEAPAASPAATAGAEEPPKAAAEPVTAADLSGTWVEYWAVSGGADTERYAFSEPGRFDWHASAKLVSQQAVEKTGTFRLEVHGKATFLVLEVERETFAACNSCSGEAAARREVTHASPLIERYELGECPSNPEAQQIDATYTCRAIGGKAFWRKTNGFAADRAATHPAAPAS